MSSDLPGSGTQPEEGPTAAKLRAYVDANAGRYTDEALTAELVRAGYAPDDIRAALSEAAARGLVPPPTGRAVRTILAAYGITFLILSLGMLANAGRSGGYLMPDAGGGIAILAGSLGIALVASLIWVASRRLFVIAVAVFVGLSGTGSIGSGLAGLVLIAVAIGVIVLALRWSPSPSGRPTATLSLLLAVPVLLLLAVGGICVASGLPIPRAG